MNPISLQTNNRIFFGESHSVSRSSVKLKTATFGESVDSRVIYKTPTKVVAGLWTLEGRIAWSDSQGTLPWSVTTLQTAEDMLTLSENGVVNVKEVSNLTVSVT